MKREAFSVWTIFEKPLDYPDQYVARRFEIAGGEPKPTSEVLTSLFLEKLREEMRARGLYCLPRNKNDEPQIVECWI